MRYWYLAAIPLFCFAKNPPLSGSDQPLNSSSSGLSSEQQFRKTANEYMYTGPLLTSSASMLPPGLINMQPYVLFTSQYGVYNRQRDFVSLPSNRLSLNPLISLQAGITDTMDGTLTVQVFENWQFGNTRISYGDTSVTLGWPILRQTAYLPGLKFSITETFPTGRYQNLHQDQLAVSGAGSFQTRFLLAISKLLYWKTNHPLNARLALSYTIPTPVHVKGYNAYGGGIGANAKVHPGNTFSSSLGLELSLTKRWVLATDVLYTCTNETTFRGNPGMIPAGAASNTSTASGGTSFIIPKGIVITPMVVAPLGVGYSDSLSIAPAIEYNWTPDLGFIGGGYFSVYGRNSGAFWGVVASVNVVFHVK